MDADGSHYDQSGLRDYVAVVRRRKWIVIAVLVAVPLAAVAVSLREEELYRSSAKVLIVRQNLAATLTGASDVVGAQDPDRLGTEATLARLVEVAAATLEAANVTDRTPDQFLAMSSASPIPGSDVVELSVTDADRRRAVTLATAYAEQFVAYRRELNTGAIERARRGLRERIRRLERAGRTDSDLYANLVDKDEELRTFEALQSTPVVVVERARGPAQVQPRPLRALLVGFGIALLGGLGLAFAAEALDTRVRSDARTAERLRMPLLGRIPRTRRRFRRRRLLALRAEPHGIEAEAYRLLRANVELAARSAGHRVLMVTSALGGEGKSTVSANLALAAARAGDRVALVDLDLRRPTLSDLFGLGHDSGATSYGLGHTRLDDVLRTVAVLGESEVVADENGRVPALEGMLEVVPAGPGATNPTELLGSERIKKLIEELRARADRIIIDAPPLLGAGDALALSSEIDALIVVSRVGRLHERTLTELSRTLSATPAAKLGVVVTGSRETKAYYQATLERYAAARRHRVG
jgi:capsular exopolysaccharide synthesis family protein